jgi:hypothetical protein
MSGSLLQRQRSPQDRQQLRAWYKIRDTFFGENYVKVDGRKALELASVCGHPNAVWLTKLFDGRSPYVNTKLSTEEGRQIVLLGPENEARALCFVNWDEGPLDAIPRAADLGDAFAQARMVWRTVGEESFLWVEKSAAQGERDGFYHLGYCYRLGEGCEQDLERAKENFLAAAELGHVDSMVEFGKLLDKDDPQRFFWFGRAAANGYSFYFVQEMVVQIRNFNFGKGYANVVFAIGQALDGHFDKGKRTIFGKHHPSNSRMDPANQALHFYEFQSQSYRKAVNTWIIIGLRNRVVKDIRKMIGKMIWDAREEAAYLEKKKTKAEKRARLRK